MTTAPLRAFYVKMVRHYGQDQSEHWESPVVMLQSLVSGACVDTLTAVVLRGRRVPHEASTEWSLTPNDIQPLYACRGLKIFTLDFDCFLEDFDDSTMEAMANVWLHLERLELLPISFDVDLDITLRGLLLMARRCRDLTIFRTTFCDRRFLDGVDDVNGVVQSKLLILDVGSVFLKMEDTQKVAAVLGEAFPSLTTLWNGMSPGTNTRDPAWNMVRKRLAESREIRVNV
ncbi:hypothetical protein HWV62_6277 [Athelia sp. TMB]|nr:hypothetical protein HWV62_6277 [Athelia sp. TMB]